MIPHTVLTLSALLTAAEPAPFTKVAEQLVAAINAQDGSAMAKLFTPQMLEALPADKAQQFAQGIVQHSGKITQVKEPTITGGSARFSLKCERGAWDLQLTLDEAGRIAGFFIRPPTPETPVPERNTTPLRLPFRGEWFVFWGGTTPEQNYHVKTRGQRRAVDFVIRDAQDRSHTGDGTKNEQFYCYGQELLAPGDGTVVTVIDGVPDNVPGSMNSLSAVGNCVILRHGEHEYGVLAHFQPYSLIVKPGDRVTTGQALGKCGNSGNSSEPHLHFHLQNSPVLQDGTGFAPYFQNTAATRDGKRLAEPDYTPLRGDRVRPAE